MNRYSFERINSPHPSYLSPQKGSTLTENNSVFHEQIISMKSGLNLKELRLPEKQSKTMEEVKSIQHYFWKRGRGLY